MKKRRSSFQSRYLFMLPFISPIQRELLQTIETIGNTTLANSEIDLRSSLRSADDKFTKLSHQVNYAKTQLVEEIQQLKQTLEKEMKNKFELFIYLGCNYQIPT